MAPHRNNVDEYSLRSLVQRNLTSDQSGEYSSVADILAQASIQRMQTVSDDALDNIGNDITQHTSDLRGRRRSLIGLLDVRSNLTTLRAAGLYLGNHGESVRSALTDQIDEINTAGATLAALSSIDLQIEIQQLQTLERSDAAKEAQRDRRIAQFAATVLLPGLWVGLLGANTVPPEIFGGPTNSVSYFIGSTIITLVLGGIGWLLATFFTRKESK